MHHNKQIAIILPDTLRSLGLQTLLADYFSPVEISHFPTFDPRSLPGSENFDYYITDADQLVRNADFFLPRRSKTMVLVDGCESTDTSVAINHLMLQAPQEAILEQLGQFLADEISGRSGDACKKLSTRETDVLQLIVKGSTNKEIADQLNISLNTVLTHRKNITSKLGIKTVSGLTFYAIMNGLVAGEEIEL